MAKKPATKKTAKKAATKPAAKKTTTKKTPAKKSVAEKSVEKKTIRKAVKKTTAKKSTKKQSAERGVAAAEDHTRAIAEGLADPDLKAGGTTPPAKSPPAKPPVKKPATPKKMTAFVKQQQQNLRDLRDQLLDQMHGMQQENRRNASDAKDSAGSGIHTGDAGSDAYDREFALTLLSQEHDALEEIEAALKRIDEGRYGVCEISGEEIPKLRLEAIPFARLTVTMQAAWEKENGNTRFRARSEGYGFSGG